MITLTVRFALDETHFIYYGKISYEWNGIESIFGDERVRSAFIASKDRASFLERKNILPEKKCLVNHWGEMLLVDGLNEAMNYLSKLYHVDKSSIEDVYEDLEPCRRILDESVYGWKLVKGLTP